MPLLKIFISMKVPLLKLLGPFIMSKDKQFISLLVTFYHRYSHTIGSLIPRAGEDNVIDSMKDS